MLIEDVAKLDPFGQFVYWIQERHAVHLRRRAGQGKPWTDDRVLQKYFFTNPYRENDKVTQWFRKNVRGPLSDIEDYKVLFATVAFRWFNLPDTGVLLMGRDTMDPLVPTAEEVAAAGGYDELWRKGGNLLLDWNEGTAVKRLTKAWDDGRGPVFTGAYMIKAGNGPRGCKIPQVCEAITRVWKQRDRLAAIAQQEQSLKVVWAELMKFPFLGAFMSYEVVCDLRYTFLLNTATDINTWGNPGPGAYRGLYRLEGGKPGKGADDAHRHVKNAVDKMVALLPRVNRALPKLMPRFEVREVEHSLCEYDKYCRALAIELHGDTTQGRMKRRYPGCG